MTCCLVSCRSVKVGEGECRGRRERERERERERDPYRLREVPGGGLGGMRGGGEPKPMSGSWVNLKPCSADSPTDRPYRKHKEHGAQPGQRGVERSAKAPQSFTCVRKTA